MAIITILTITILVSVSFTIADKVLSQESSNPLSINKGIEIALDNTGLEESQIENLNTIYSNKGPSPTYEIQFDTKTHKYSYIINAHSGEILSYNKTSLEVPVQPETNNSDTFIDLEKAKAIALSNAQLNYDDVLFTKSKLDKDDAAYVYEIEFTHSHLSYEYDIDAYSGKILEKEIDD